MSNPIFAIGDIHGRFDLLEKAQYNIVQRLNGAPGTIVYLGDYIDRGPQSADVVRRLIAGLGKPNIEEVFLKGNHEAMMVEAHDKRDRQTVAWWLDNGGYETVESYGGELGWGKPSFWPLIPTTHVEWMRNLPFIYETDNYIFVHAGLMPGFPVAQQGEEVCMWIRDRFLQDPCDFWGKHIVHGHTPVHKLKSKVEVPEMTRWRTNLDTGAYHTGELYVGVFDSDKGGGPIDMIPVSIKLI